MEYREHFKKYYNIGFDSSWEVHHIDLNHNNDDIDNLILLPAKLHKDYHNIIQELRPIINDGHIQIDITVGNSVGYIVSESKMIGNFYHVMWNVSRYAEFMQHLKTRNTDKEYPDVWKIEKEKGLWLY